MPCLKYLNICMKLVLRNGFHLPSTYGLYCYRSKIGHLKQIGVTRNLSSYICRENFIPFEEMIEARRLQARKSIVVQIDKENSVLSLESLCCKFGNIKSIAEFKNSKRMILIEFDDENSVKEIFHSVQMSSNGKNGTRQSPFLKLKVGSKFSNFEPSPSDKPTTTTYLDTSSKTPETSKLLYSMKNDCKNISEQIQYYYDNLKMSDLSWRLRFLTCRKVEWALPRSLSHSRVIPFGSSVNTFGHNNCDLDMNIDFSSSYYSEDTNFPLQFQPHPNDALVGGLEIVANLLLYYMSGFNQIQKILHARVPIIKCKEMFTGLDCDITSYNMSGHFMSEILYLYGCSDPRVRPFVFCIRLWAKEMRLTRKDQPGTWFSNFTMTILVMFFLMNTHSAPVIPPLSTLEKLSQRSFTCDGIKCSYTRDVNSLPLSENTQTLEELLLDFFSYYSSFSYKNGISIISGKTFEKQMKTALLIQNPLESNLNVAQAVTYEHLHAFQEECMRTYSFLSENSNKTSSSNSWGLHALLENKGHLPENRSSLNIKALFEKKSANQISKESSNPSKNNTFMNPRLTKTRSGPLDNNVKKSSLRSKTKKYPSYQFK